VDQTLLVDADDALKEFAVNDAAVEDTVHWHNCTEVELGRRQPGQKGVSELGAAVSFVEMDHRADHCYSKLEVEHRKLGARAAADGGGFGGHHEHEQVHRLTVVVVALAFVNLCLAI
jgi:hypothetical protein